MENGYDLLIMCTYHLDERVELFDGLNVLARSEIC